MKIATVFQQFAEYPLPHWLLALHSIPLPTPFPPSANIRSEEANITDWLFDKSDLLGTSLRSSSSLSLPAHYVLLILSGKVKKMWNNTVPTINARMCVFSFNYSALFDVRWTHAFPRISLKHSGKIFTDGEIFKEFSFCCCCFIINLDQSFVLCIFGLHSVHPVNFRSNPSSSCYSVSYLFCFHRLNSRCFVGEHRNQIKISYWKCKYLYPSLLSSPSLKSCG